MNNTRKETPNKPTEQKTLNFVKHSSKQSLRLGSLARWGSALVRRGSRVRIPPEAPQFPKRKIREFEVFHFGQSDRTPPNSFKPSIIFRRKNTDQPEEESVLEFRTPVQKHRVKSKVPQYLHKCEERVELPSPFSLYSPPHKKLYSGQISIFIGTEHTSCTPMQTQS